MKEQLYGMLENNVKASWRPLRQHTTPSLILYNFSLISLELRTGLVEIREINIHSPEEEQDAHRHGNDDSRRIQDTRAVLVGSCEYGLPCHKLPLPSSPPQEGGCWGLVLKCYESRTRQHKMLSIKRPVVLQIIISLRT
jgi:hypothetical protein